MFWPSPRRVRLCPLIPGHPDSAEGEGWLIGFVIDSTRQTTDLVILDTRNFEGAPLASIHLPHRVPPGFHGNWVPSSGGAA